MTANTPEAMVKRITNAIGIIDLRLGTHPIDVMPQATSVQLCKMILLEGAALLDHFSSEAVS